MINDFFKMISNGYPLIIFVVYIIGEILYLKATNGFNMNTRPLTEQRLFGARYVSLLLHFCGLASFHGKVLAY